MKVILICLFVQGIANTMTITYGRTKLSIFI